MSIKIEKHPITNKPIKITDKSNGKGKGKHVTFVYDDVNTNGRKIKRLKEVIYT